jgi:hypothetical protein
MEGTAQIDLDILPPDIRITFPYRTESAIKAIEAWKGLSRANGNLPRRVGH